ncbi:D-ala D-ala ligase N-terminus, partial [Musa troglodytarum]
MASLSRPCLLYRGFFEDASRRLKKAPAGSKISLLSSACGSSPILGCSTRVSRSLVSAELGARLGAVRAAVEEAKIVQQEEEEEEKGRPLRVGIICGGPSAERGISLNSARSVLDHIQGEDLHVSCYYIDCSLNAYAISPAQLYSNTPADFDFKLESLAQGFRSLHTFVEHLAVSVDIVFPVIHGRFGEDGGIQELLEKANVPFVGTASHECRQAFDKVSHLDALLYNASLELSRQGFLTVPSFLVQGNQPDRSEMIRWFEINHLHKETGKVVVAYHTPPRFPTDVIECIRQGASLLFQHFGLRDFARIDGWFLPGNANMFSTVAKDTKFGITESGNIIFTDINLVGFSHSNVLRTIIQHACLRYPSLKSCSNAWNTLSGRLQSAKHSNVPSKIRGSQKAFVLFGGETSERQVSLMSGTNVWLNLQGYDDLDVIPCLLAPANGYGSAELKNADQKEICRTVWTLPYSLVLRHTTEEVLAACIEAVEPDRALLTSHLRDNVMRELSAALSKHYWFSGFDINEELPANFTLENWIKHAKESHSMEDLEVYVNALRNSLPRIPANSLLKAHGVIEMPSPPPQSLIFEPFIETDEIIVSSKSLDSNARHLTWEGHTGWVEVTVGVMGTRGEMHSLSPSITVKETGDILSLEEKFQGGTGINLTPPPAAIISDEALQRCKQRIEIIANTLGLEGFSRIDAFMNVQSGEVLVIEVNTIPGMTPSTALIHQYISLDGENKAGEGAAEVSPGLALPHGGAAAPRHGVHPSLRRAELLHRDGGVEVLPEPGDDAPLHHPRVHPVRVLALPPLCHHPPAHLRHPPRPKPEVAVPRLPRQQPPHVLAPPRPVEPPLHVLRHQCGGRRR